MTTDPEPQTYPSIRHADGRVCYRLPYALESQPRQLLHAYFYGESPELRKCDRAHGLDDEGAQS